MSTIANPKSADANPPNPKSPSPSPSPTTPTSATSPPTEPPTQPGLAANSPPLSINPLELPADANAATQTNPAAGSGPGGESAPVTASTTSPSAVAQSTPTSPMDSNEPKPVPETSTEPSDEGKELDGPSLVITLLLTTGSRHPFTIDGKYLKKRSVAVENNDPFLMSVYTLKELIWREWRSDWETRPTSPSAIRLISFGKLLDDKSPVSDSKFSKEHPNVVHMTVKPQEVVDEEDAKGAKAQYSREGDASERSPGCRCVIL
ncbi:uncharacterized protein N7529_009551 [Penicillium soppii]|uniref:uncharacterized protein n=1 Tax=Penicillium soppii TaxID=69789 RepID=UPI00254769D7|nr:uncharacterized protein N7529_009551 [Penicillium soppii]KAJ5855607.1 hypothetical protein N7529_009551 [Penicillium soppii]